MGSSQDSKPSSTTRLVIIGAGPIGLEAAARAAVAGIDVVVLEKEGIGHHFRLWGHVRLFSPFHMNHSDWGTRLLSEAFPDLDLPPAQAYLTGAEYVQQYLEPLARLPQLRDRVLEGVEVVSIGRDSIGKKDLIGDPERARYPFRLLIRSQSREQIYKASAVIDASGVYSCPQSIGSGNVPAAGETEAVRTAPLSFHSRVVDVLGADRERFAGNKVLLVGGGHSAATALEGFAELVRSAPGTRVHWVNRSHQTLPYVRFPDDPLPHRDDLSRLANRLAQTSPSWLRYHGGSSVEEIQTRPGNDGNTCFTVMVDSSGRVQELEVDEIVANVGFRPDNSLYRQLQVQECYATAGPIKLAATLLGGSGDCLKQELPGIETLQNPEPNFFIAGNKSYGTNPSFLISQGLEQIDLIIRQLAERLVGSNPGIVERDLSSEVSRAG